MLDLKGRKIGDVSQHEGAVSLGPNRVATQSVRLSDVLGTCWTIRTNFDDILDDYLPEWTKYEVVAQMYEGHYIARVASLRAPHPVGSVGSVGSKELTEVTVRSWALPLKARDLPMVCSL